MSDTQDYEALLPKFREIASDDVRRPDMPVHVAVAEAEAMGAAAKEDEAKLTAIGVPVEIVDGLPAAAGALRAAHAMWVAASGEQKEAQKQWAEREPDGFHARDEVVAAMRYAFRKDKPALRTLRNIQQGRSQTDMIQDLRDLAALGDKNVGLLEQMNFDPAQLEQCRALSDELGRLQSQAFVDDKTSEAKDTRDRAFTYMRGLMSEILDAAEYVFRNDRDRLDLYYSRYRSRSAQRSTVAEEEATLKEEALTE
jgi:hypothetical protein